MPGLTRIFVALTQTARWVMPHLIVARTCHNGPRTGLGLDIQSTMRNFYAVSAIENGE